MPQPEVDTCAAIIAAQPCGATILPAIALAPQLFLNGCAVEMATAQRTRPHAVVGAPRRAAWQ